MQVRSLLQIAEAFGLVVFRVDYSAYVKKIQSASLTERLQNVNSLERIFWRKKASFYAKGIDALEVNQTAGMFFQNTCATCLFGRR